MTDKVRSWLLALFGVGTLVTLGGWIFGRDPAQLSFLLGSLATGVGIGEASAVGKRATFKPEAQTGETSR